MDLTEQNRRARLARRNHQSLIADAEKADRRRARRDKLIRELRAEGWTYKKLADAVGCSPELIAKICKS